MSPVDPPAIGPDMGADPAALVVSGVVVQFGGVRALGDVHLSVAAGKVTGLIGPNGAGKTTLFNVIGGLQRPNEGRVFLFGEDITKKKPHQRARRGLARTFQRLELFGSLSAAHNVQVGLESTDRPWTLSSRTRRSAGTTVPERLAKVGIGVERDRQASEMPTGTARLVELARALAIGPKVLLLDEPGSGLDETESEALGDLLVDLSGDGVAVLLVEHDMELVMRVCDYIYVLDFGQIIASGTPDEIRTNAKVQAAYLGAQEPAEGDRDPSSESSAVGSEAAPA